eukprot:5830967-Pleurochrysis_carterae.AAC.1
MTNETEIDENHGDNKRGGVTQAHKSTGDVQHMCSSKRFWESDAQAFTAKRVGYDIRAHARSARSGVQPRRLQVPSVKRHACARAVP